MEKTAVIYARVSTGRQAEDDLSIPSQVEACERKAADLGAQVVKVFKDEGLSGKSVDRRPAFLRAVEYCGMMEIDYFILWDTKRFARNHVDAAVFKRDLRHGGTQVVYVAHNFDGEDGWMLEGMFHLFDDSQRRRISIDTKRSMIKNARDGYFNGADVPYGYRSVPDGKRRRLQICPEEADVVRRIFRDFTAGAGAKSIAMTLNRIGALRRLAGPWTKGHVLYLLKNWVYAGYVTFNRFDHENKIVRPESEWIRTKSHEPIITEEAFARAQELFPVQAPARAGGTPRSRFAFSGLLRCVCGSSMQIETASGRSRTYSYYNCRSALTGKGCRNRRVPAAALDAWLLEDILNRILTPARISEIIYEVNELCGRSARERAAKRATLVAELHNAEQRRRKLYEVLELHGINAPNLGDLKPRLTELNDRIKGIDVELTALEDLPAAPITIRPSDIVELANTFRHIVEACEDPRKIREFLASFITSVDLMPDHVMVRYHPEKLIEGGPVHGGNNSHPNVFPLRTLRADLPQRFRRAA